MNKISNMNERQERFIELLRQIFELDKADLDFGIYRILNIRRREIEEFFTTRLPQKITETLQPFAAGNKDNIRQRMNEIESQLGNQVETLPDSIPLVAEYKQLKQQLQQGADLSALESDVYSALYSFFSRYYDEGDFISKRRYKEGVYAIPYEGEEVKLYWANQDQYYIKTSENFKDYTFVADGYNIHFRLVNATTEQNNNKESDDKKRKFMLFTENEEHYPGVKTFEVDGKNVNIRFFYDVPEDPKVKYEESNLAAINEWINSQSDVDLRVALLRIVNPDAKADKRKTLVQKHLEAYVAKNSFDYFIHKDLGGFLSRELDFFIKNEVMHLDDLDTESEARVDSYLAKVRAIKRVGKDIITFLAQLENFQKRLWLKKKFVVETNWCITLDRVPKKYYDEIRKNKDQVKEWKEMYKIHEIELDLEHTEPFTEEPSLLFLEQNQNLIVDTKHFTNEFKQKLTGEIDKLDEQTNGLLAYGDNFHTNRLIRDKLYGDVNCVFIDPPYNTGDDDFIYKDNYQSSSWLSMLNDRLKLGMELVKKDGLMFISIGDEEQEHLSTLVNELFGKKNFFSTLIWEKKKKGSFLNGSIAKMKDYVLCVAKNSNLFDGLIGEIATDSETYPCVNADNPRDIRIINYPIPSKYRERNYKLEKGSIISAGNMNLVLNSDLVIKDGYLVPPLEIEGNWRYSQISMEEYCKEGTLYLTQDLYLRRIVDTPRNKRMKDLLLRTADDNSQEYDFRKIDVQNLNNHGWGTNEDANDELLQIIGEQYAVSYPKPSKLIAKLLLSPRLGDGIYMDYFAGSGTTGHSVLTLNRLDGRNRKYILSDMGDYFYSVAVPRIKKVIYSENWNNGTPISRNGISQCFKYIRLEQYEDALNNIRLMQDPNMQSLFGDDYTLQYMLDIESRDSLLNVKAFTTPFEYEMRITEKNETKARKVDVCETFNYLIGLNVIRQGAIHRYQTTEARHPEYEGAVDLVIDREGVYQFRQIEGTLRDGKRVLVIWRNITDDLLASNAALDAYFTKFRINPLNRDYDIIYVNGDSNIENLRTDDEHWKVVRTEAEFNKRMFEDC